MSLPYVVFINFDKYEEITDKMIGMELGSDDKWYCHYEEFGEVEIDLIKPILRPLSDLTKEIDHKGEKFVPIVQLAKIAGFEVELFGFTIETSHYSFREHGFRYGVLLKGGAVKNGSYDFVYDHEISAFYNTYPTCKQIHNQLPLFQKLIELHFDIAGLIEKGEAIDVNTLEINPYK